MPYLIGKMMFSLTAAGLLGFLVGWWWTRHAERRRSHELEGVWTQKVQRANRELDALRSDLRNEATRVHSTSDVELALRAKLSSAEIENSELADWVATLEAQAAEVDKLKTLATESTAKAAGIEVLQAKLNEAQRALNAKSSALTVAESMIATGRATVAEREATLEALRNQIRELEAVPDRLKREADDQQKSLEAPLATAKAALAARDTELGRLTARIAELEGLRSAVSDRDNKLKEWEARHHGMLKEKDTALARLLSQIGELEPLRGKLDEVRRTLAERDGELQVQKALLDEALAAASNRLLARPISPDDPNAPDDLKKIRGIGPVLQKRLTALGVTSFEQIAKWSDAEIDEHQKALPEFKDRIRRDKWIDCAKEEYAPQVWEIHLAERCENYRRRVSKPPHQTRSRVRCPSNAGPAAREFVQYPCAGSRRRCVC